MNPKLMAALASGRLAATLTRTLHLGGGTVLPGHVAARLDPDALSELSSRLAAGVALISGTNGKTTTARMLASIARVAGLQPVHNRAGANLPEGILSALVDASDLVGNLHGRLGVFEVDEAHLPGAARATLPRAVVLTNLFRDQLDRYGEVDFVARSWAAAVKDLGPDSTLIVNVDDPSLAHLAESAPGHLLTFGVENRSLGNDSLAHEADRRLCPVCAQRLDYSSCYYGHLGTYECGACGWKRPTPDVAVLQADGADNGTTAVTMHSQGAQLVATLPAPGLHNVYNAAAAAAAALALDLDPASIVAGLEQMRGAFGRHERIRVGGGTLTLDLVKNPVGFNQALRTVLDPDLTVIAINDRFADGTDVSWLWDVDFERLAGQEAPVLCTGLRAHDLALRLKYAGVGAEQPEASISTALGRALERTRQGGQVALFCTYTATLEARSWLQGQGLVPPFWDE
ncbi:MAG: DUF1727 domain-containing protein [Chloroflexi bacterium]|nr:DUF1727 domain-containing protein [Chloroflexota bacterium]